jgi:dephospho-CoA kinase
MAHGRPHMLSVGLTGGIGSGKSTVCEVLRVLGIPIFDADAAGKRLLAEDPALRQAVIERFGPNVYPDGRLDRKALAAIVFNDPNALADLNALVHPLVRKAFQVWMAAQQAPYVVMESALLADTGGHAHFDQVIVVTAPEALRIARVMQRDGVGEEAVKARMRNQVSEEERLRIADHVVVNDGARLVVPQVLRIDRALRERR